MNAERFRPAILAAATWAMQSPDRQARIRMHDSWNLVIDLVQFDGKQMHCISHSFWPEASEAEQLTAIAHNARQMEHSIRAGDKP